MDGNDEIDLQELADMSLEELSKVEIWVTTASKKPEKLWEAASAVYVITQEDIRRSAATTIPDLLRMVPGLFVGNVDSSTWIVGTRGLANEYAVDLLVLIDGRQVNFLGWGGTFWNIQDYPLEDIERIEIIRGPGGTLWGTNSGNGVINIITKHAKDTQGGLVSGIAGTDLYKGVFRYGGKMGKDAHYRIYGIYKDVDSNQTADGNDSVDNWSFGKAGFRIDWTPSEQDAFTFQGDVYQDDVWFTWPGKDYPYPEFYPIKDRYIKEKEGIDLQVQWDHTFDDGSQMKWLTYYDYFSLGNDEIAKLNYDLLKTDIQYQFHPFSNHEFIVGGGYRLIADDTANGLFVTVAPQSANKQTFTAYFQDNYTIIEDKLKLSLGSHFQYSDYSGFDYQPSARLTYTPYEQYTIWASITRSAQHYYRGESETSYIFYAQDAPYGTGVIPMLDYLSYEGHADSESILSFEIGQRLQSTRNLSFDLTTFYNLIDDHCTIDTDWEHPIFYSVPIPHFKVYGYPGNNLNGETYGAELAANAQITETWKLMASYSALDIQLHRGANSNDFVFYSLESASPHHQIKVQSYLDIVKNVKLDASYYFIDEISGWGISPHGRLDVRLGWEPTERLEVSVVGTNLLDDQTHEANGMYTAYTEVERGVYAKLTYRF
jgi:iron complex outermembrane receptor protein